MYDIVESYLRKKINRGWCNVCDPQELIYLIQYKKKGNREVAIFVFDDNTTQVHVGNPNVNVRLGEVQGDYVEDGREGEPLFLPLQRILERISEDSIEGKT